EIAASFGFLQDRINAEVAFYRQLSDDQLTNIPTPMLTGFPSVVGNWEAVIRNQGVELSAFGTIWQNGTHRFNLRASASRNKNILLEYPDFESSPYYSTLRVGKSVTTAYYLNYLGVDPLTGKYVFEDANRDGAVSLVNTTTAGTMIDDRVVEVDISPSWSGSLSLDYDIKRFTISAQIYYV